MCMHAYKVGDLLRRVRTYIYHMHTHMTHEHACIQVGDLLRRAEEQLAQINHEIDEATKRTAQLVQAAADAEAHVAQHEKSVVSHLGRLRAHSDQLLQADLSRLREERH